MKYVRTLFNSFTKLICHSFENMKNIIIFARLKSHILFLQLQQ